MNATEHVARQGQLTEGDALSLLPTRTDWPEHEAVEPPRRRAAAVGEATEIGAPEPRGVWGPRHTQWAGLAAGAATILLCLLGITRAGWLGDRAAWWALGLAALALAVGALLTRGLDDATAGSVYATVGLACAITGGALLMPGDSVLGAGLALLAVSLAGLLAAAGRVAVLAAGATAGLLMVVAAVLTARFGLAAQGAVAVVAGAGLVSAPLLESWSRKLGRVPFPVPPARRTSISAPVVRADGVLTGLVVGIAAVVVPCQLALVRSGGTAALLLVAILTVGFVLRSRVHHKVPQRLASLVVAGCGALCLAADPLLTDRSGVLSMAGPALIGLAALAVLAGLQFRLRSRTPRRGGYDVLEVLCLLVLVPAVCAVLGLYG